MRKFLRYFFKHLEPTVPYSPDLVPYGFWLFLMFRGCRYETVEMKEAASRVIDTLTQEDFQRAL